MDSNGSADEKDEPVRPPPCAEEPAAKKARCLSSMLSILKPKAKVNDSAHPAKGKNSSTPELPWDPPPPLEFAKRRQNASDCVIMLYGRTDDPKPAFSGLSVAVAVTYWPFRILPTTASFTKERANAMQSTFRDLVKTQKQTFWDKYKKLKLKPESAQFKMMQSQCHLHIGKYVRSDEYHVLPLQRYGTGGYVPDEKTPANNKIFPYLKVWASSVGMLKLLDLALAENPIRGVSPSEIQDKLDVQFLTETGLVPSFLAVIPPHAVQKPTQGWKTHCDVEFQVEFRGWEHAVSWSAELDDPESKTCMAAPSLRKSLAPSPFQVKKENKLPNFTFASMDIETYSHVHTSFPYPLCDQDVIISISTCFWRAREPGKVFRFVHVLDGCAKAYFPGMVPEELDPKPEEKERLAREEEALLDKLRGLANTWEHLDQECKKSGRVPNDPQHGLAAPNVSFEIIHCKSELELLRDWQRLCVHWADLDLFATYNGSAFDECYIHDRLLWLTKGQNDDRARFLGRIIDYASQAESSGFSSKAFGSSKFAMFKMPGRVKFDVYTWLTRNSKMRSYKLESVASELLKRGKIDLPAALQFKYYQSKNPFLYLIIAVYNNVDTDLVRLLIVKRSMFIGIVERSRTTSVDIDAVINGGQQALVMGPLARMFDKFGVVRTKIPAKFSNMTEFQGATVLDPVRGYYAMASETSEGGGKSRDGVVMLLDFASLYPSIMRWANICYTTILSDPKHAEGIKTVSCNPRQGMTHRFTLEYRGILPRLLEDLVNARSEVRKLEKQAEDEGDKALAAILNNRQNALKITCNSVYGFCAAQMMTNKSLGESVTAIGRDMLNTAKGIVEGKLFANHQLKVIYGDTDSLFVHAPGKTVKEGFEIAAEISVAVSTELNKTSTFGKPLAFEIEGVADSLLMLTKKKYAMRIYSGPSSAPFIKTRGLMSVRTDFCKWMTSMLKVFNTDVLEKRDLVAALKHVDASLDNMVHGRVPLEDVTESRKLGSDYKNADAVIQAVVASKMTGEKPEIGARIEFVMAFVPSQSSDAKVCEKAVDVARFVREKMTLDSVLYIQKVRTSVEDSALHLPISKAISQCFEKHTKAAKSHLMKTKKLV